MKGYKNVIRQTLIIEIEITREIMIVTALKEGFTSKNTIRLSKRIDHLLNELDKINKRDH
ncbi:Spo0E family sporulation regulatory protein-aspartic acid phosphatase [Priestia megaterium]|uniref:Spo0E family sporulation regulatory protein-aspartic acid phosphatase n=1 Tax=Priestia megaterium TaxID=1404 RepID=UPI001BEA060A|nr:Spo0E family sporulation regulatory protein-aspartic acid phosphatase [Priestia megaterium]MBT2259194.1 Spo0E family sporulation regulatory protein-aspartic acid phosphatase [Priestia megaterium]